MKLSTALYPLILLAACSTTDGPPETMRNAPKLDQTPIAAPKFGTADEEAILRVVDTFLLAVGNGDRELQKSVEYPDGALAIARITKDNPGQVRRMPASEFQKPTPNHDPFIEMYWAPQVQVRGPFAQVWSPYVLRNNGAVVHCGINAFQLVKDNNNWMIASALSSMEPEACAEMQPETAQGLRPRNGWKETPNQ
jgi:hypothetical protein